MINGPDGLPVFTKLESLAPVFASNKPWMPDDRIPWEAPSNYVQPETGGQAEYDSLQYHVQNFYNVHRSAPANAGAVLDVVERMYASARWHLPIDWCSEQRIREAIISVHMTSSCGYPYMLVHQTNRQFIEDIGLERIVVMVKNRIQDYLDIGPEASDPIRLFVKDEPHKSEKAKLKRWRLIWSVSVIDQIVDTVLFGKSIDAENANHLTIPSKVGLNFYEGGANTFMKQLDDGTNRQNWIKTDKSAWDWTYAEWLDTFDLNCRARLCYEQTEEWFHNWYRLAVVRGKSCTYKRIVLSDGTQYQQTRGGIVDSGGKRTISKNSRSQVALRVAYDLTVGNNVDLLRLAAMGDDTVEQMFEDPKIYCDFLLALRFIVKEKPKLELLKEMEFCSHRFIKRHGHWVMLPTNWEKHKFRLKFNSKSADILVPTLSSLCLEYCFDDEKFRILHRLLVQYADNTQHSYIKSQRYLQNYCWGAGNDLTDLSCLPMTKTEN